MLLIFIFITISRYWYGMICQYGSSVFLRSALTVLTPFSASPFDREYFRVLVLCTNSYSLANYANSLEKYYSPLSETIS